ncbi:MAG: lectin-like domain-containing protein, partial [Planctomycetaceae bacterium]
MNLFRFDRRGLLRLWRHLVARAQELRHQRKPGRWGRRFLNARQSVPAQTQTWIASPVLALEERVLLTTTITANIFSNGADIVLTDPDCITIASGVILNSSSSTGVAGNILLSAPQIVIQSNVTLSAMGSTSSGDGSITLDGCNLSLTSTIPDNPLGIFDLLSLTVDASITIGSNVTITGGDINLNAFAGDDFDWYDEATAVPVVGQVVNAAFNQFFSFMPFVSLPLSVAIRQPTASITTGGATINSSGSVNISADASGYAAGAASFISLINPKFDRGFAAGLSYADSWAVTEISSDTTITAQQGVIVSSNAVNTTSMLAQTIRASKDMAVNYKDGVLEGYQNLLEIDSATTFNRTVSHAIVDAGASIISNNSSVAVTATAIQNSDAQANSTSYLRGNTGISLAVTYSDADVLAQVDGQITAANTTPAATLVFNPDFTVDFQGNSLVFASPVTFQTGDPVIYSVGAGGQPIPGLVNGATYFAIVNPSQPNNLQLATSRANANLTQAISFGAGYPTLQVSGMLQSLPVTQVNALSDTLAFGYSQGSAGFPLFTTGNVVQYTPAPGQYLGYNDTSGNLIGALPAGSYTVQVVNSSTDLLTPFTIQLLDSNGEVVDLNSNPFFSDSNNNIYQVYAFDTASGSVDLNAPSQGTGQGQVPYPTQDQSALVAGMTNAMPLVYHQAIGTMVSGLTDGATYYAIVDPANPGVIQLAVSQSQAEAANPVIQSAVPTLMAPNGQPLASTLLLISSVTDSLSGGSSTLQNPVQALSNNASGGSFTLSLASGGFSSTTASLPYNASAAEIAAAIQTASGATCIVSGAGTPASPWQISLPSGFNSLLVTGVSDSLVSGSSTLQSPLSQQVSNDAAGGTFALNLTVNGQTLTTAELDYDASPDDIADAIGVVSGVLVSVSGSGTAADPWVIAPTYNATVSSFQSGGGVIFDTAPGIADGTPVVYNEVPGKPIFGLTDGATYYLYNQTNSQLVSSLPQYVMALRSIQEVQSPALSWSFQQSLQDMNGNSYTISAIDRTNDILTVMLPTTLPVTVADSSGLTGGTLSLLTLPAGTASLFNTATGGSFLLTVNLTDGTSVTTAPLAYNIAPSDLQAALMALPELAGVSVSGLGTQVSPWMIVASNITSLQTDDTGLSSASITADTTLTPGWQLWTDATGGTFTISVSSSGGLQQTTAPISWDATAAEVQQALYSLQGLNPTVSGGGTADDPWVIDIGSATATVDPSSLTVATGNVSAQMLPGSQLWTDANSGNFSLVVTPLATGALATVPLPYNATAADLQLALQNLGYSVTVTGQGTADNPWNIVGEGMDGLEITNLSLTQAGAASSFTQSIISTQVAISSTATGGMFFLAVDFSGVCQTTLGIAWNASADEVANALNALPGVAAWVSGSGSVEDPWVIQTAGDSLVTGSPVIFQDGWGVSTLGLLNGTTYYAVPLADQPFPGQLSLQLATSLLSAQVSPLVPAPLDTIVSLGQITSGGMFGTNQSLTSPFAGSGISITASLLASDSSDVYTQLGGLPRFEQRVQQFPLLATSGLPSVSQGFSGLMNNPQMRISGLPLNRPGERLVSASTSLKVANRSVLAVVGPTARLLTAGSVAVTATIENELHGSVEAFSAVLGQIGSTINVGLNLTFADNTCQAIIHGGALVTGGAGVSVNSTVTYPLQTKWLLQQADSTDPDASLGAQIGHYFLDDTLDFFAAFGDGSLGIDSLAANQWTNASGQSSQSDWAANTTLSASLMLCFVDTTNVAQIEAGAQINTLNPTLPTVPTQQPVSVSAETDFFNAAFTGMVELNWSYDLLASMRHHHGAHEAAVNLPQGTNSYGACVGVYKLSTSTQALIGSTDLVNPATPSNSPTIINYGNNVAGSGLNVSAETNVFAIQLAFAGSDAQNLGLSGAANVFDIQAQETVAAIVPIPGSELTVQPTNGTVAAVNVSANDWLFLINGVGDYMADDADGVGVSAALNLADNRTVIAQIGTNPGDPWQNSTIVSAGDINLSATADGLLLAIALATEKMPGGAPQVGQQVANNANAANNPESTFGMAVSGDFSMNLLGDRVEAIIADQGALSSTQSGATLSVVSSDATNLWALSGGYTSQSGSSESVSFGLQGSVSLNYVTSTVNSILNGIQLTQLALDLSATTDLFMIAASAGGQGQATALGQQLSSSSLTISGSIAYNYAVLEPLVSVTNVSGIQLGDIDMSAIDNSTSLVIAGTLALPGFAGGTNVGKFTAGVGLAGAINNVTVNPQVEVSHSHLQQSSGSISLAADQNLTALSFAAGIAAKQGGFSIAGQFADVQISSTVEAKISQNSTITSTSQSSNAGLSVVATLSPLILSVAGNVMISKSLTGQNYLSAGLAVVNVDVSASANAEIDDSDVQLLQGDVQLNASAGSPPPGNQDTVNQFGSLNLPNYTGNNIYSFAIGAAGSKSAITGELSLVNNNIGTWDFTAQITNNSTVTTSGNVVVDAFDNSTIVSAAGNLSISLPNGTDNASTVQAAIGAATTNNGFTGAITSEVCGSSVSANSLNVTATNDRLIGTAAAGGEGSGSIAGGAAWTINTINSTTTAQIAGSPLQGPTVTASQGVSVSACDTSTIGAGAGQVAIGFSPKYSSDVTNLSAGAAAAANSISSTVGAAIDQATVEAAGNVEVTAEADLAITAYAIGVSGSISTTNSNLIELSGAGSGTGNWIESTVTATVCDSNILASALSVAATDSTSFESVAGSLAIQLSKSGEGESQISVAVGASVAKNYVGSSQSQNTVTAEVVNSTLSLTSANTTSNALSITASSTVEATAGTAAGAGSGSANSTLVDGSGVGALSGNMVFETVLAQLSGGTTTLTGAGDINIAALNSTTVLAWAGGLAVAGAVGATNPEGVAVSVGAAMAHNEVTLGTSALVTDSAVVTFPEMNAGGLIINATGDADVKAVAVGVAGVFTPSQTSSVPVDLAGAGSGAMNSVTSDVTSTVDSSSSVSNPTSVSISATEGTSAVAGAGALAITFGLTSRVDLSVGVSIAENTVGGDVTASIDNATVTTAPGGAVTVDAALESGGDHGNAFAVAVAGSLAVAANTSQGNSKFSLAGAGAGAGIYNTVDFTVVAAVQDDATVDCGPLTVSANDDSSIYSNAGGVGLAVAYSTQSAESIAIGAGVGTNDVSNTVQAEICDSKVNTSGDLSVTSVSDTTIQSIGFGVALGVSVASGQSSNSGAGSGAAAYNNVTNTTQANITGGQITAGQNPASTLTVTATDSANITVQSGAGSLAVSVGQGAALAAGVVYATNTVSNTTQAWLGTLEPVAGITTAATTIAAAGPVTVSAASTPELQALAVAVAAAIKAGPSAAGAGAGANAVVNLGAGSPAAVLAGIESGTNLNSSMAAATPSTAGVTVSTSYQPTVNSTIGSGALSGAQFGASIGVSLGTITDSTNVVAEINGATIKTNGTGVSVATQSESNLAVCTVATSASISLGGAGAGSNSTINDLANYTAQVLGTTFSGVGALSIVSNSADSLSADTEGGSLGLGSIGVFLGNATRGGSTTASMTPMVPTSVSTESPTPLGITSLSIGATTNQSVDTSGYSLTVGVVSGSGVQLSSYVSETVTAGLLAPGSSAALSIPGSVAITATSTNEVTSSNGTDVPDLELGLAGAGAYLATAGVSPVVSATVEGISLTSTQGGIQIQAESTNTLVAESEAGSGGILSGDASQATTNNNPTVTATVNGGLLSAAGMLQIRSSNQSSFTGHSDSVNIAGLGGSGTVLVNNGLANVTSQVTNGASLSGSLGVQVVASDGYAGNSTAKGGAGGTINGNAVEINTGFESGINVLIGSQTKISGGGAAGVQLAAMALANLNEGASLTTGGIVEITNTQANQSLTFNPTIAVGDGATLSAPIGNLGLGIVSNVAGVASASCDIYGLSGGNAYAAATNSFSVNPAITVGSEANLSGQSVVLSTSSSPLLNVGSLLSATTNTYARNVSVTPIADAQSSAQVISAGVITLEENSTITSQQGVSLSASPLPTFTTATGLENHDGIKSHPGGTTTENITGTLTIDGTVEAGSTDTLEIVIPAGSSAGQFTVNGQTANAVLAPGLTGTTNGNIAPGTSPNVPSAPFLPFTAVYDPGFNPQSLLTGLDATTLALISPTISSSGVSTLQLSGLQVSGGQVVIATGNLQGTGTVSANIPEVTITNDSAMYLVLDGLNVISGIGTGEVVFTGSATAADAPALSLNPFATGIKTPTVTVSLTESAPVGTTTNGYGPSLFITNPIINATGDIILSVANGSVVQQAGLNAMGVEITVPNGVLTVTSSPYTGIGGNIADAWAQTAASNSSFTSGNSQNSQTNQTIPVPTSFFLPGLVAAGSGVTYNPYLAVTTAVNAKFNPNGSYLNAWDLVSQSVVGPVNSPTATSYVYFGDAMPYLWGYGNDDSRNYAIEQTNLGSNNMITGTDAQLAYLLGSGGSDYNMGYLPLIMPNLPLAAQGNSVPSAVSNALDGGITAAAVSITANIIDLNAQLNVGRQGNLALTLGAHLGELLQAYQASYQANPLTVSPIYVIPAAELTAGVSASFNCLTGEITVDPVLLGTANVEVILTGQIMSSLQGSAINVSGGPGTSYVNNYTGFPVVLSGLHAGAASLQGTVIINDTFQQTTSIYTYAPGGEIQVYTGAINQVTTASPPSSTVAGTSTTFRPAENLVYTWNNTADLTRPGNVPNTDNWGIPSQNSDLDYNYGSVWSFTSGTTEAPYVASVGQLTVPSTPQPWLFMETVSATINQQYEVGIIYHGNYDFDNPFTQTYVYPYDITLTARSSVVADNPVTINFGGLTNGSLQVSSNANLTLGGTVMIPGSLSFNVLGSLLQNSPSTAIPAATFNAPATVGSLGSAEQPLNLALLGNGAVSASASQGVFLTAPETIVVDQITTQFAATATLPGKSVSGFGGNGNGWTNASNNAWVSTIANDVMTLTHSGTGNTANAWWYDQKVSLTQPFAVSFTYTGEANGADGIALVLQNSAAETSALGAVGGGVGYAGIGKSIALILDIYAEDGVQGSGFALGSNGSIPALSSAAPVALNSGHPIDVLLQYDPMASAISVSLTDQVTQETVTQSIPASGLTFLMGGTAAYLGFTGADGGVTSTQTISNFSYISSQVVTPGQLPLSGFNQNGTGWILTTGEGDSASITSDVLTLTQSGTGNTSNAAWFDTAVPVTQPFAVNFTYTGQANGADGIAFVLQNDPRGTGAVGATGGGLGYSGIANSVALALDIYGGDGAEGTGFQWATNGTLGSYEVTSPVILNSGHPIQVGLIYNPGVSTINVTLVDTVTGASFSTEIVNQNLAQFVNGSTAYLGFTGADGGVTSTQTISNFQFQPLVSAGFNGMTGAWTGVTSGTGAAPQLTSNNTLPLTTTSSPNTATALWFNSPVPVAAPFQVNFTYTGQPAGDEGVALVFQNDPRGLKALGSAGMGLGYSGIQNSAALLLDIWTEEGTAWVTAGNTPSWLWTESVNLVTGNPIDVSLTFNPSQNLIIQTLTDPLEGTTFTHAYQQFNLQQILAGSSAWIGFTGGTGSLGSNQVISDFSILVLPSPAPISISAGGSILAASSTSLLQGNTIQLTAGTALAGGQIGTSTELLPIQITPVAFFGAHNPGSVSASASGDINLQAATGNLVVESISSPSGTVRLEAPGGSILSGSGLTNLNIPMNVLTGQQLQTMIGEIDQGTNEGTAATVNSFENTINQSYSQYWNIQQNAPLTSNNLVVNTAGLTGGTITLQPVRAGETPLWTAASGGTFTLTVTNIAGSTATTAPLAWNSSATQIATAINGLTDSNGNCITGLVTVTGSGTSANPWQVVGPALQVTLNAAGLQGGGGFVGIPAGANLQAVNSATGGTFTLTFTPFGGVPQTTAPLPWNANANMIWNALDALPGMGRITVYGQGTGSNPWLISGQNFSVSNVPTASALLTYQFHASVEQNLANPTTAQTLQFASGILQNAVNMFANPLVFGPDWWQLPQFNTYSSAYQFAASIDQTAQLTYGASYGFTDLGLLAVDALTPTIPGQSVPVVTPQIVAQNLVLSASGTIGQVATPTVIEIEGLADNSLSTNLQSALTLANGVGGAVEMVAQYPNGELVSYSYGSVPTNATPLGIQTPLDVPLFIDLAPGGSLSVLQSSQIAVVEVQDDLTLGNIQSSGEIDLTAQGGIFSQSLASDALSTAVLSGFGTSGVGWTINSNNSGGTGFTAEVNKNVLYLTDVAYGNTASSAWHDLPVNITNGFTATFTYNGMINGADGTAFVIQNSSAGPFALGSPGGGLGYAGIGNSLAVALDIYGGDGQGGNALQVATNGNLGNYLSVSPVSINSGAPIEVTVTYDASTQSLTVSLLNPQSTASWSNTFSNINLTQILGGSTGWIGFTGADGGVSSNQSISNFALTMEVTPAPGQITEIGPLNSVPVGTPDSWVGIGNGNFTPTVTDGVLTLTQSGIGDTATAVWYSSPISVSNPFEVNFTYQGQANGAEGIAFVLQNSPQGLQALGGLGSGVGYSGIANSVAIILDIYAGGPSGGNGVQNAQGGVVGSSTSSYTSLSPVEIGEGHAVDVTLSFVPQYSVIYYTLTDTVTGATFRWNAAADLWALAGANGIFLGFTGGSGELSATQTISNFSYTAYSQSEIQGTALSASAGGNLGTSAAPLTLSLDENAEINLYSGGSIWVAQPIAVPLTVGEIQAAGSVSLTTGGSIIATDQPSQGSLGGFGGTGSGWTTNGSAQIQAAINPTESNLLVVDGTVANESSATWYPNPVLWQNSFSTGFIITPSGNAAGLGLTLTLQNDSRGTAAIGAAGSSLGYGGTGAIQNSIALQIQYAATNAGSTPELAQVGFGSGGQSFNQLSNALVGSPATPNPVQVILDYDAQDNTLSVQLIDTVTGTVYASGASILSNLQTLLGNNETAWLGITGATSGTIGSSLSISNFYFAYGAANIQAADLTIASNGSIGSANQPVVIQVAGTGNVDLSATNNATLLQLVGNLNTGLMTAGGTLTLLAPAGSVVASGNQASVQVAGPALMAFAVAPAAENLITANTLVIDARHSAGSTDTPLQTQVSNLQARGAVGDIVVHNTGALRVSSSGRIPGLVAGGQVQVSTTEGLTIDALAQGVGPVNFHVADQGLTHQALTATANAQILSQTGTVGLFAPDAVQLQPGSLVSAAGIADSPQVTVGLTRMTSGPSDALIQSQGQIVADRISLVGGERGTQFEVAHSGLTGQTKAPAVSMNGTTGSDRLVINHRDAMAGQAFTISDAALGNALASYAHQSIESVLLDLGNFADTVTIQGLQQLRNVEVRGNEGDDQFRMNFLAGSSAQVLLNGGLGSNRLTYDGAGLPLW